VIVKYSYSSNAMEIEELSWQVSLFTEYANYIGIVKTKEVPAQFNKIR
jgi:hypothetical protein